MRTSWSERFAQRTQRMRSSAICDLLKVVDQPDVISFAGGLPAPEVFPVARFTEAVGAIMASHATRVLQYGTADGYRPLRDVIARKASRTGLTVGPDNVLPTSGSQQALDLIGKVFVNPGDRIVVERPTYTGAIQAWDAFQAEYVAAQMDRDGCVPDAVEACLRTGPKFIYTIPNFQNPSGITASLGRRRELVALADRWGVPIVEDDPYGQLRYEGEPLPRLIDLDARSRPDDGRPCNGNVIYLSTFSKILAPGIRLGWVIAPVEVIQKLRLAKQGADYHAGMLSQFAAHELAASGFLDEHVQAIRDIYRERRDTMLAALARECPEGVTWTKPEGGLFLWLTLPEWMDAGVLLRAAAEQQVVFVPGESFFTDGSGRNTARLSFSNASPERIEEGVRRLGACLRREIAARNASPR